MLQTLFSVKTYMNARQNTHIADTIVHTAGGTID
jgi:hypothetical protein